MDPLGDKFVYQTDRLNYIIDWVHFIDDIFLIWKRRLCYSIYRVSQWRGTTDYIHAQNLLQFCELS